MEALAVPLILLSLPLCLGLVPRNRFYGFRVPSTLRSDAVWYPVNTSAGRQAVGLGLLMIALEYTLPPETRAITLRAVAIAGGILIIALNWRQAIRLDRKTR